MSLVSNLVKQNITFKFDGSTINVDVSNCDKLVECKIPFTFNDGCISLEKVEQNILVEQNKVIGPDIMTTIYNLLVKSGKFGVGVLFDKKEDGKHRKNIIVQYKNDTCTLNLYRDKFVMVYDDNNVVINFENSWTDIQCMMPQYGDGLVLMILAGFYTDVKPVNWRSFYCGNNENLTIITYNVHGLNKFEFCKNGTYKFGTDDLNIAIRQCLLLCSTKKIDI